MRDNLRAFRRMLMICGSRPARMRKKPRHRSDSSSLLKHQRLNLDALQGTLEFSELRLQTAKSDLRQTTPTRISIARGQARLEGLNANSPNATLAASGSIDLKGEQRVQLDAAADMQLAALAVCCAPRERWPHTTGRARRRHSDRAPNHRRCHTPASCPLTGRAATAGNRSQPESNFRRRRDQDRRVQRDAEWRQFHRRR